MVLGIACSALLSASALAQSAGIQGQRPVVGDSGAPTANAPAAEAKPAFVIADIHASPHRSFARMMGPMLRGDRYFLRQAPMRDLVGIAYNINPGYVKGGPVWLETDRYDVNAKMPPGTTADTARLMMRALLEDRFKLVARATTALAPGGLLTVGTDKVKMKQSNGSGDAGCKFQFPPNPSPGAVSYMSLSCHNISMEAFAPTLHNYIYEYMPGPIADSTGLKGTWDFDLKWNNRGQLATAGADGITIFDAVEKQLGLKLLQNQMAQRPVVTVDSVNETPTPNSPDLKKILPPLPPPEIEVATIKPSEAGERGMFRFNGVQMDMKDLTLKSLIYFAWDLNFSDDEVLVGAPKWLDSDRFDIVAKVATDADGKAPPFIDIDDIRRMLRALLVDRFKIKTHTEDRPITAFTMMTANLKLRKADPASHTRCAEAPGPDGKDPRIANPVLDRLVTCQNMTMAQIAGKFQELAEGYIYSDVKDATGVSGSWDFTLSFSSSWLTKGGGGGMFPAAESTQAASDPNGAISFFDAVDKQLGLKLEKQKRSLPVLVIDHIEEQPTAN
jgi:uncharacterized protein (TIGR03435 family)